MSALTCPRLRVRQHQFHRAAAAVVAGNEDLPTLADDLVRAAAVMNVADELRTTRGRLERALRRLRRYLDESASPPPA